MLPQSPNMGINHLSFSTAFDDIENSKFRILGKMNRYTYVGKINGQGSANLFKLLNLYYIFLKLKIM